MPLKNNHTPDTRDDKQDGLLSFSLKTLPLVPGAVLLGGGGSGAGVGLVLQRGEERLLEDGEGAEATGDR